MPSTSNQNEIEARLCAEFAYKLEEDIAGDENFKEVWEDWGDDSDAVRAAMNSLRAKIWWLHNSLRDAAKSESQNT